MVTLLKRPVYYGWVLAWVLGLTEMVSWGIMYYGFGVMLPHMRAEMGWTTTEASLAFSIGSLVSGFAAVAVGRRLDARGPRVLMTVGSVAGVVLVAAWASARSLLALYLVWAGLGLAMAATLYEPAFWVVARWFARKRSRALTVVTFWGGLASTAFIPLANTLIETYGWRTALWILAAILALATILPHALLLRRSPRDMGAEVDGDGASPVTVPAIGGAPAVRPIALSDATRMTNFWLLAVAFILSSLVTGAMGVHLISLALDRGEDASYAAWAAGMVGVLQVVGRLTLAPLGDRMPRKIMTAITLLLQAAGLSVLAVVPARAGLLIYVVLFGLGHGTLTPMRASLIADVFGLHAYGAINGAISLAATVSRGVAPVAAGAMIMALSGYTPMLWVLTGCAALAAAAVLFMDRRQSTVRVAGGAS